jgi:hypothetical protein
VHEYYVPAFIGTDEMGEVVNNSDTMFNSNNSIALSGYCFGVPAFVFESLLFSFDLLNIARQKIQC